MLVRYASYSEFLAVADGIGESTKSQEESIWGSSYQNSLDLASRGDDSLVSAAEKLCASLLEVENGVGIDQWQPSVAGAYPCVPDYIAGHPLSMRAKSPSENLAPVAIYVSTTISAAIGSQQIMKRGTAILALVLQLQKSRPVDLFLTAETHGETDGDYIQVIPIESRPLSIAHACYALTAPLFARHLTYAVASDKDQFNGGWGHQYTQQGANYPKWIHSYLDCTEKDLYIKPAHINDPLINNPIAWTNEQLARYNEMETI